MSIQPFNKAFSQQVVMSSTTEDESSNGVAGNAVKGEELKSMARSLIKQAIQNYDEKYGSSSISCNIVYNMAWVSLITKTTDGQSLWLFEECFHYLLHSQSKNGSWQAPASQVDEILNTAVALLSLERHRKMPLQTTFVAQTDLHDRISLATHALQSQLEAWDVVTSIHTDFEIIVSLLLELLEQEGITFNFDGSVVLESLRAAKMADFMPEMLYKKSKSASIHHLEAFIGTIDLDKIGHHKVDGALMASPAATAAYLMAASSWDYESEAYLRHVIGSADKFSVGALSDLPLTHFKLTCLLSTLLRAGYTAADLASDDLTRLRSIVTEALVSGSAGGRSAPSSCFTVNSTTQGLVSISMLQPDQRGLYPNSLVREYATKYNHKRYPFERELSLGASCNMLLALVRQESLSQDFLEIIKMVRLITDHWWGEDNDIKDKQNLSPLYLSMLLMDAFVSLLEVIEKRIEKEPWENELKGRVSVMVAQVCIRALLTQQGNGSWSESTEQTSYGILMLCQARRLSFLAPVQQQVHLAIESALAFIKASENENPLNDHIWVDKVAFGLPFLTQIYKTAALKAASLCHDTAKVGYSLSQGNTSPRMNQYIELLKKTPMFFNVPDWQICCSFVEATLFQPMLRSRRLVVFARKNMGEDQYFDMIPFFWTACNNRAGTFVSTSFLFEMMVISFLNFQVDEYMEAVAGPEFASRLDDLRLLVGGLFQKDSCSKLQPDEDNSLRSFVSHVLRCPSVARASSWDRESLARELRTYLLSHVDQAEDNARLGRKGDGNRDGHDRTPPRTFFDWVRTTSANQTSCSYAFAFVSCLLSSSLGAGAECFRTATQKYVAEDFCRHLATMCRMYNDYGSAARDEAEGNLNSVDFPEFALSQQDRKEELLKLAEYERGGVEGAMTRLAQETAACPPGDAMVEDHKMAVWRVFRDVTDLHGQIYVIRDIASRKLAATK